MSVYDHKPMWAGAFCDPAPAGGAVTRLALFSTPGRDGDAAATIATATRVRAGVYRFELPDVAPGRYWGVVTFTPSASAQPVTDTSVRLDLPTGQGLVGSPEQIADALGVPLPLSDTQRAAYAEEIRTAQADVAIYLNRPLVPSVTTIPGLTPRWTSELDDVDTWGGLRFDDVAEVLSYRANPDGTYDVDFLVGLDGAKEDGVVRYVIAHAAEGIRQRPDGGGGSGRRVTSVSAEGQSISYDAAPTAGQAGALPTLDSLKRLRRLTFQSIGRPAHAPWPYSPGRTRRWY
ncbi:hypothetical protein GTY65_24175 [Streptomyces sp. SID8379]|uniref:hypothetical protein n=1 Tax=unclassified Streptomyces TaxID=2593676 RepID=UPI00037C1675|nr:MULTISPECIES: hypothetical protein [unclassified Streptomyces]MYW67140.1 hypothetical protein [Streptomyces sp. SID8379]